MAIGSGLASQLGYAEEAEHGTYVAPTRFLPYESESLKLDVDRDEAPNLLGQGATTLRSNQWAAGARKASGGVKHLVHTKGFGLLFKHMFGKVAITTPTGATNARDHTHTLDNLFGLSLTGQAGRPDVGGTVNPFSYTGLKIAEWEISNAVKGFLELGLTFTGKDESTDEDLASASYPAGNVLLHWAGAAITIAGTAFPLDSISLKGSNGLGEDRHFLGQTTPSEHINEKRRELGGTISAEFEGLTAYNRFVAGSTAAIVATWTGPQIEEGFNHMLQLTLPVCRFDGDTPNVEGPSKLAQKLPFVVLDNGTLEPATLVYRTTDTES